MPNLNQRPKISVEDLLRLKRAERPTVEFWDNFDRELRQKQLTALLEKRPWWHELPQFFARRVYLPVGATAILAFSLVSVKYYVPAQITLAAAPSASGHAVAISPGVSPSAAADAASAPVSSALVNRSEQNALRVEQPTVAVADGAVAPAQADDVESSTVAGSRPAGETPSARSIAANLARLEQSEPELVNSVLGSRLSPAGHSQAALVQATELASVSANSTKRSYVLAQYSERPLSPEPTAPAIVRERLSRRLGDSEITDRLSRIGIKGDQISLGVTLRL